jgi:hypothetical protein
MEYEFTEAAKVVEEIDKALKFIASSVEEEAMVYERTLVATPLRLAQHVLTKARDFLAKGGPFAVDPSAFPPSAAGLRLAEWIEADRAAYPASESDNVVPRAIRSTWKDDEEGGA